MNVGPVMPGVAENAAGATNSATAAVNAARSFRVFEIAFFMFVALIAALLIAIVPEGAAVDAVANVDLGHQPAEVLGVIR